jgi:hypothetical protein
MRGQVIVAWAQCRQAFGKVREFTGWAGGKLGETLEDCVADAVTWVSDMKTEMSGFADNVSTSVMTATNSGDANGEHIPRPYLHGEMSIPQQWEKLVTVTGFTNVYGISISALPDPATPPIPPQLPIALMGSIVLHTATYAPPPLYQISDFESPRFDFTSSMFLGWEDKPVTPMAVPWGFAIDSYCVPAQWENQSWNVNIPIAKHLIPPAGLSIWGYWNSLTQPRLKVKLITAPITGI